MRPNALATTLALLLLAGCAWTPDRFRKEGATHAFTSTRSPTEAALCIARSVENRGAYNVSDRPLAGREGREIVIRIGGDAIAMGEITPTEKGSKILMFTPPDDYISSFAAKYVAGC